MGSAARGSLVMGAMVNPTARRLLDFVAMEFSWPIMLGSVGGFVAMSLLLVWGVRVLGRHDREEETASALGVELAAVLAREPRLRDAAILPVATIPIEARPSVELTGHVPSAGARRSTSCRRTPPPSAPPPRPRSGSWSAPRRRSS